MGFRRSHTKYASSSDDSDGTATRQLFLRSLLVDMDPLLVAGCLRKEVDAFLGDFNPFAGSDFAANCCLEFTEVAEDAHVRSSNWTLRVRSSFPEPWLE